MKQPIISVLIPMYNCRDYIRHTLDSILNQTFKDFEVVIIDDGSTDGSNDIVKEYEVKDSRIKVYRVENGGVGKARNIAISYAVGEYVVFIDHDDFVKDVFLEELYNGLIRYNADIFMCNYYQYVENDKMYYFHTKDNDEVIHFTGLDAYNNMYNPNRSYNILFVTPWPKIIRKILFDNIYFPTGKSFEDSFTVYKLYLKTNKIYYVNKSLYVHRIHDNNLTYSKWTREKLHDYIEHNEERFSILTVLKIPASIDNINDYMAVLRNALNIASTNGYIEEYQMIKTKLDLIEQYNNK